MLYVAGDVPKGLKLAQSLVHVGMITMRQIGGKSREAQDKLRVTFRASSNVMCPHFVPLLASPSVLSFLFVQVGCVKASSEHPRIPLSNASDQTVMI